MLTRKANMQDYPQLRQIYLNSRRGSFHWANAEEMTLDDFDRDTVILAVRVWKQISANHFRNENMGRKTQKIIKHCC